MDRIKPMLPNKPRGVPRVNDRRVLNASSFGSCVQVRHTRSTVARICSHSPTFRMICLTGSNALLIGDALDNPKPAASRQAGTALEYAEPRAKQSVCCSNPDTYHNAELDVSGFPDHITFNDIQPRMVCSICDHRGADVSPSWLRSPSPMAASSAPY
jgi:hypothetical protein